MTELNPKFFIGIFETQAEYLRIVRSTLGSFLLGDYMLKAQVIELRPSKQQKQYLSQCCGIKRFAYNSCLEYWNKSYQAGEKPNKKSVISYIYQLKEKFTWIKDVSSRVCRSAIDDLENAFKMFFSKTSKYPRFKKKGINDSFSIREKEKFTIDGRKLRIEKLKSKIKMRNKLRFLGTPKQITIRRKADKWFASILVETIDNKQFGQREPSVGVDLGVSCLATLSNGVCFDNPKPLKKKLKTLAKLQRSLSRKQKGSKNREKAKLRVGRLHYYISCQRKVVLHEITTYLVKHYDRIVIEDLNVSGMLKNHNLSQAISDVGFYEFRRQLEYKSKWYNCELVIADRFYPSSKLCSNCGQKKENLSLSDRIFKCDNCGFSIDRDVNATINLNNFNPTTGRSVGGVKPECSQESSKTVICNSFGDDGENSITVN